MMLLRRVLLACVAVVLVVAWPVLAATTNTYLPLVLKGVPSNTATFTTTATDPLPTTTGTVKPGSTVTPTVKPGSTATPSNIPTATATGQIATTTPTVKPGSTATSTSLPTTTTIPGATATPTPLPPSLKACQQDPNADNAPHYPVKITAIDKDAETVTLKNVSAITIDLSNWTMCSITGNQTHPIGGTLAPGNSTTFAGPAGKIWNNSEQDDGALYDPNGSLVSYLVCQKVKCP